MFEGTVAFRCHILLMPPESRKLRRGGAFGKEIQEHGARGGRSPRRAGGTRDASAQILPADSERQPLTLTPPSYESQNTIGVPPDRRRRTRGHRRACPPRA